MTKNSNTRNPSPARSLGVSTSAEVAGFKAASARVVAKATASPAFAKKIIARVERPSGGTTGKKK